MFKLFWLVILFYLFGFFGQNLISYWFQFMFNVLGQNQFLGLFWWPGIHGWNETIMNGLRTSVCWTRTGDYNIRFISGPDDILALIFRADVDFFMLQLGSERNLSKPQAEFWQVILRPTKITGKLVLHPIFTFVIG